MISLLNSIEDFEHVVEVSRRQPLFIFKHSTRCGTSLMAQNNFKGFAGDHPEAIFREVLVVENRELSNHIARESGIGHQSPQVILYIDGAAVWDASHWHVGEQQLAGALMEFGR